MSARTFWRPGTGDTETERMRVSLADPPPAPRRRLTSEHIELATKQGLALLETEAGIVIADAFSGEVYAFGKRATVRAELRGREMIGIDVEELELF